MPKTKTPNHLLKRVLFEGTRYNLVVPYRAVSEDPPLSEGPFYAPGRTRNPEFGFLPDARFLAGLTKEPSAMHRVQLR